MFNEETQHDSPDKKHKETQEDDDSDADEKQKNANLIGKRRNLKKFNQHTNQVINKEFAFTVLDKIREEQKDGEMVDLTDPESIKKNQL